ncbi:MAG TPA: Rid family detoxifying hydrolase [Salinisphaeraceae bacterium]|nr:Rid family detoxifying hydrolase [Salinisphaeraceae bacterium]
MSENSSRQIVTTENAPAAIGPYSQAVRSGDTIYISGQIPLDPHTQELVEGDIEVQATQVFANLAAVATAAGASLQQAVRITIYMIDIDNFAAVNRVMERFFEAPFPARAALGVAALPKGAAIEADAILVLEQPA